jgi:hypothetical protein
MAGWKNLGNRIKTKYCGQETFSFLLIKRKLKHTHNSQVLSHLDEGSNVPFQGESKVIPGLHYLSIMP